MSTRLPRDNNLRLLYVANKKLPDSDYRVMYASLTEEATVVFGLPQKPDAAASRSFRRFNFTEGLYPGFPVALLRLASYMYRKRREYDFVHFYSTLLILFGPLAARFAGVPAIVTVTGFGRAFSSSTPRLRWLYLKLLRSAIQNAAAVLFQNSVDMEWIRSEFDIDSNRLHLIGSGVAMDPTPPRRSASVPFSVVMVSRIMTEKGIEDFLHVARRLQPRGFRFVLIGPMSRGSEGLFELCLEAARDGIIEFEGEQSHAQTLATLEASHVLFFPSSYGEGLARVMIEAGFAGLCPIAYEIPPNLDLVRPDDGYLLPPGDTDGVVAVLERLSQDRDLLHARAASYQSHIVANYSIGAYVTRMDHLLEELSTSHPS